jgi:hypothetical protein
MEMWAFGFSKASSGSFNDSNLVISCGFRSGSAKTIVEHAEVAELAVCRVNPVGEL